MCSRHLKVHSEKEPNWLLIQRKSHITCKFGDRAKLAVNLEKAKLAVDLEIKQIFLKFRNFLKSLPTNWKMPDFLENVLHLGIDGLFVSFSELTTLS